jgi:putative flippase GtrA
VAVRGPLRTRQKALFVGSAMIGLALTIAIVGLADLSGIDPRLAKLVAIAVSFAVTWMLRSKIVFRTVPVAR